MSTMLVTPLQPWLSLAATVTVTVPALEQVKLVLARVAAENVPEGALQTNVTGSSSLAAALSVTGCPIVTRVGAATIVGALGQ